MSFEGFLQLRNDNPENIVFEDMGEIPGSIENTEQLVKDSNYCFERGDYVGALQGFEASVENFNKIKLSLHKKENENDDNNLICTL